MYRSLRPLLLCLLVLLGLTTCQKKKYPPQLSAVSPASAPIGADITLTGSQFGDNPTVIIGSTNVALKTKTDASISLTVPRMTVGPTTIRVQNEDGASDPRPFTVLQPLPQLTGVEPANGLAGTTVRITGDFLDKLKAVRFGTAQAEVVGSGSEKEVGVKVPTGLSRGPLKLTVETEGGQAQADFIVAATPQITGFSPKRAIVGQELTITGKGLLDGLVTINGLAVDKARTSVQDEQIKTVVPTGAASGRIVVTVFDKLVATSTDSLVVIPPPIIDATGLSITEGIKGDKLTITGRNLLDVTNVAFGGTPATGLKVLSNTQLEAFVPERSQSGETAVTVMSPGGTVEAAQKFVVILSPADLSTDPDRQGRNKEITVRGRNLHRITAATVNGKAATITARTEGSELKLTVPADATTGKISLTNRAGSGTTSRNVTVVLKPRIESFTAKAPVGGRVVIKGDFLLNARVVFPNTNGGADFDGRNQDDEVWVKVPAGAKDGPLRVWNNESGEYTDTDNFNVILSPTISSVTSEYNSMDGFVGERVTINGQNFDECTVRFEGSGQNAENVEPPTRSKLVVKIPGDARTGKIVVRNTNYSDQSDVFRVIGKPDITDISPNRAKAGQTLTVKGSNLLRLGEVKIGGQTVPKNTISENADGTQVNVTVPDAALRGRVYAANKAGSDEHKGENFVIVRKPVINGVSPMKQAVGRNVTITGDYLMKASVSFGGKQATNYPKNDSDTELIVTVPDGANDGAVRVSNDADSEQRDGFNVIRIPSISNFNPRSGGRGSEVTIEGQNLNDVVRVKFNGGNSSDAQILDGRTPSAIRVRVPNDAVTGRICLYNEVEQSACSDDYVVNLPPTLSSVSNPSNGNQAKGVPGAEVIIYGNNLGGVQEVKFGDKTANIQAGKSNGGQVVVNVPDFGGRQDVQITVRTGAGWSTNSVGFTGAPRATIDKGRCVPQNGFFVPGASLTLKGSNFQYVTTVRFPNGSVARDQFLFVGNDELTIKVPSGYNQSGSIQLVNDFGDGQGTPFSLLTGGDGLNIGNVSTSVVNLVTSSVTNICTPFFYGFCYNGTGISFVERYGGAAVYPSCGQGNRYKVKNVGGSTYWEFTENANGGPAVFNLKMERTPDGQNFTGFVIIEMGNGEKLLGNVVKPGFPNSGDIIATSVVNGRTITLCSSWSATNQGSNPVVCGNRCK